MWIDSHSHLNDEAFAEDCRQVIATAREAEVGAIVVVGYDLASSLRAVELAAEYAMVWAAVGVHPQDAATWNAATEKQICALLSSPKVVALGEIGLDYHYDYPREQQRQTFRVQLALARQYDKPVIIHNREAHQDTLAILRDTGIGPSGGVMHCFSGSRETAAECLGLGLFISLAGPLTFANAAKLREVAATLPLDKLLVETDAPYLTPAPFRGKRNEPARVGLVGEKLAEIKGLPVAAVMAETTANCRRLFKIGAHI